MKKLVIKTALFTLAVVIGLTALIYGGLALFNPSSLARFYDEMGNYNLATRYYEKQYEKTLSNGDLYTLCLELNEYSEPTRAEKYLAKLIDNDSIGFTEFCQAKDEEFVSNISTKEYCIGKYVCAVYVGKGCEKTIDTVSDLVKNNYTEKNGFYMLINDANLSLTSQELSLISTKITVMIPQLTPEGADNAWRDINLINQKIANS